jgi:predicted amidophosphoribosyltransferase
MRFYEIINENNNSSHLNIMSVADYYVTDGAREIAHKAKKGDLNSIRYMAKEMARIAPRGAVFIPVPSRYGKATDTMTLATIIASMTGGTVANILSGSSRESLYNIKKRGDNIDDEFFNFRTHENIPNGRLVIVDNIYDTGATVSAIAEITGAVDVLVYSDVKTPLWKVQTSRNIIA